MVTQYDKLNKRSASSIMQQAMQQILNRIDEVNSLFISKVATQVQRIGELNQSSINRLLIVADMGMDIA